MFVIEVSAVPGEAGLHPEGQVSAFEERLFLKRVKVVRFPETVGIWIQVLGRGDLPVGLTGCVLLSGPLGQQKSRDRMVLF